MIRRALLALGGLVLAPSGSSAAAWPGPRGLPYNARSGLCAPRREDLLTAIEIALVLGGTGIAVAGGLLSARNGRPYWLLGAVVVLGVLGLCTDGVLADQEPLPGWAASFRLAAPA